MGRGKGGNEYLVLSAKASDPLPASERQKLGKDVQSITRYNKQVINWRLQSPFHADIYAIFRWNFL